MFRLQCVRPCLRRLLHQGVGSKDYVLEGLQVCSSEDQLFDVVGKNKTKLTVEHVSCAVRKLWDFQKERPDQLKTVHLIKRHPQFLTLRVLAENKISLMDDIALVDMLYSFVRLSVEPHDSLVQQMVSEAWRRLDSLPMSSLSKFSVSLIDQFLKTSPLMGHITNIVDQKLSSIDNGRVLAALMVSVSNLVSPRLRDALISRAECLLDTMDPLNYSTPRKMVQFLRSIKYIHRPLLEKCNKFFLRNIPRLDVEDISYILGLYQSLQFHSCDFTLAAKERLIELIDTSTDPHSFSKLFISLAPISSMEIRKSLEDTALLLADEFSANQALAVVEALEESQSRNFSLVNKIVSVIQKNLHDYRSMEVARITQALYLLHYQNPELFAALRTILVNFLQRSFYPYEVTMLTRVLSMLPSPRLEEDVVRHVDDVLTQCNLNELITISFAVAKWIRTDPSYRHSTHSKYVRLLQRLSQCGRERLQTADRLDLVLDEIKFSPGEWFEEMLLEETLVALNRMINQINPKNIADLAFFLTRTNRLHPPLMDRIASVAIEHTDKIHFSAIYPVLLLFSVLNYEPAHVEELYDACIKHFTPHICSFEPHLLVLLAYCLALVDRFPEELIREIFSIDFLGKLDCQLESMIRSLLLRVQYEKRGQNSASWSSIGPCVWNVQSFRCRGFTSVTASISKKK
ncbi:FAST kinase domain-containing protein 1, mitochondrial isoform X2 [Poeciliopsis prolifica]|uniref:FAST kinase domain-containing protein 1, mitochondrial isoform X2 n=1 Tax=Poeciliopsis prolifica TaxID=188132 RepID=UPI002413C084|nr:FAST kinase domain-containing protein 1, mitochondrial isoform X2 [Poeciliopsis prolifica]